MLMMMMMMMMVAITYNDMMFWLYITFFSLYIYLYLSIYLGSYPPSSECHKFEFPKWDYNEAPKGTLFAQLSLICTIFAQLSLICTNNNDNSYERKWYFYIFF